MSFATPELGSAATPPLPPPPLSGGSSSYLSNRDIGDGDVGDGDKNTNSDLDRKRGSGLKEEIAILAQSTRGENKTLYQTLLVSLDPSPMNIYNLAKQYSDQNETARGERGGQGRTKGRSRPGWRAA